MNLKLAYICFKLVIYIFRYLPNISVYRPEVTPGGRALRFYSSIRLEVRKGEQIQQDQEIIGHKIKIKVVKNKLAPPYKNTILSFYFKFCISLISEIIEIAVEKNIIEKSGSWYSYQNISLGQGKEKVKDFLENNKDIFNKIKIELKL